MIHNFEAPFVAWYSIKNHHELKAKYYPIIAQQKQQIQNQSDAYIDDTYTSYFYRHQDNPLKANDILDSIVWQPIDQLFQEKPFTSKPSYLQPTQSKLQDIWWNWYQPNGFAKPHKHAASDFSGIYLFHLEETNTTHFLSTYGESQYPYMQETYDTKHITEGHVMIFPSFLYHYVVPSQKERIVLAWNIHTLWGDH